MVTTSSHVATPSPVTPAHAPPPPVISPSQATPPSEGQQRRLIATYAVLIGLTPFIPVPFVDDVVEAALLRRFVRGLAASRSITIGEDEVRGLATGTGDGVLKKVARGIVVYPIKKLFRKTFFFLEGKRVVDLASLTFCRGYLLDLAFARGWAGGGVSAGAVNEAIEKACREAGTSPIEHAARAAFNGSRAALSGAVEGLTRAVAKARGKVEEVASEAAREASEGATAPVERKFEEALRAVPAEYFQRLSGAFATALGKSL